MNFAKYHKAYYKAPLTNREWPDREITEAPIWCSVDLRDGNQALYSPMTTDEKIEFFKFLVKLGFREIEVGFPAASNTEFEFVRRLIEENLIPSDVTIQVLTQAREHIIRRTVEAVEGAENAIIHIYNSTSELQRRVVFRKSKEEILKLATDGAKLLRSLTKDFPHIRYEYSPESFTCTEPEYALLVCNAVLDELEASPDNKVIINLPATIEVSTPNIYADQIEYIHKNIKYRDSVILSVHAHNDRGTGIACTELAMLAGVDRVEGTIFGNGERTGNADIITVALNMFCQGIDPKLNIINIDEIIQVYEHYNRLPIHPRHPYAGEMAYVAFSGSHQDAIKKSMAAYKENGEKLWENPYLTIDPTDINRRYEPILINSQSGKGGVSYVMETKFGYELPRDMLIEFSKLITDLSDKKQTVLSPEEILGAFNETYVNIASPIATEHYHCTLKNGSTEISAELKVRDTYTTVTGEGNGPLDAICTALRNHFGKDFEIVSYVEHALEKSSSSLAVSYISIKSQDKIYWGAGIDANINTSSIYALLSAVNKTMA